MFSDSSFKGFVVVFSLEGLLFEVLSVLVDVLSELVEAVGDSVDLDDEDVVDHIVTVEDFSIGIFDHLGELGNFGVVLIGSLVEGLVGVLEFSLKISNDVGDGGDEFLKVTLGLKVEFSEVKDP